MEGGPAAPAGDPGPPPPRSPLAARLASFEARTKNAGAVSVATRYTLTPEGDATTVRIDGEFTGAAVSLMAGKLKDSGTAALNESLRKLTGLVT